MEKLPQQAPKRITQETFNMALNESICEFGMTAREALPDVIAQFKAQGVDLSNICTEYEFVDDPKGLTTLCDDLENLKGKPIPKECIEMLTTLKKQCERAISYRALAAESGGFPGLMDLITREDADKETKLAAYKCMASMMKGLPHYLNPQAIDIIMENLEINSDPDFQKQALKWAREVCVKHERNRVKLFERNLVNKVSRLLNTGRIDNLKEELAILRAIMRDDDISVDFSKAPDYGRVVALLGLGPMLAILKKQKNNESVIVDLMLTISALIVRTEFCEALQNGGILELVHEIMQKFHANEKIIRQCFKLVKALAGNDECKAAIIQKGYAPIITSCLDAHKGDASTVVAAFQCVSALALRSPENSKALFEADLPDVIIDAMKKHPDDKLIQRYGSWAIRNMVSRSRYQNKHFIELGAEDLLQGGLGRFKEFEYDFKAALRDLECEVDLKEEWTGKGGLITTEAANKSG